MSAGPTRIAAAFAAAAKSGRAALIPYVTAGYPNLAVLPAVLQALQRGGADLIEIGIPFSDPLADGPVLQRAASEALRQGLRVADIFAALQALAPLPTPVVLLTYFNPVLRYGVDRFLDHAAAVGFSGLVIPDLPWVEAGEVRKQAKSRGLALVPLVAPTSTESHLKALARAQGFVYAVSVTGVTGAREQVDRNVGRMVARIRQYCRLPVAIGFGIAGREQARTAAAWADGVIVGSALVERIGRNPTQAAAVAEAFVADLAAGLGKPPQASSS